MASIAQRMNNNCCGTTCSKYELLKAVTALEESCKELAGRTCAVQFAAGNQVVLDDGRHGVVMNFGISHVAVQLRDGTIEVRHQSTLELGGRLP